MYCVNCGTLIGDLAPAGEHICKGCGKLSAEIRDELLSMSEKQSDLKCPICGGTVNAGHLYCGTCGAKLAS